MTAWIITEFVVSAVCLVVWGVTSRMDEENAWNEEAYTRALEKILESDRKRRNSEDSSTQKWSD